MSTSFVDAKEPSKKDKDEKWDARLQSSIDNSLTTPVVAH